MKFLRAINGKTRKGKIMHVEIRGDLNVECMRGRVKKMRIRWHGHARRKVTLKIGRRKGEGTRSRGQLRAR